MIEDILGISFAIIGFIISIILSRIQKKKQEKLQSKKEKDISELIEDLDLKMNEAKKIQRFIDNKIESQLIATKELSEKNEELKSEVNRLTELKKLSENQISALGEMIQTEMNQFSKKSLRANIYIASGFFFLGVLVTILVQILI